MISITLDGVSNNDNFLRIVRLVLRLGDAAAGRGRSGHGDDRGRGRARPAAAARSASTSRPARARTGSAAAATSTSAIPALNTNYWFNERNSLPKNDVKLNQYGVRVGGPIVIPGLYDGHDKAFFFFHYEQLRFPNSFTRTRTRPASRARSTAASATRSAARSAR